MNKKFSTLVASLLLSSAFSVYAGNAKPMLATPTQVETRATSADVEAGVDVANLGITLPNYSAAQFQNPSPEHGQSLLSKVLPGFTNNSRIFMVGDAGSILPGNAEYFLNVYAPSSPTTGNVTSMGGYSSSDVENYYWTLANGQLVNNAGRVLTIDGVSDHLEIIPIMNNGNPTQCFVIGNRDSQGNIRFVKWNSGVLKFTNAAADYTELQNATFFVSVETAYLTPYTYSDLDDVLDKGFTLDVTSKVDADLDVVDANVFTGSLKTASTGAYYQIKNGNKFIVFDSNANVTSDGFSEKGKFKLVDGVAAGQYSYFQVSRLIMVQMMF